MKTFLETAELMAAVDDMPADLVPQLLRRIRIFDAKGLVKVERADTGRREGRLDLVAACMARLHSELIDFGLDAETLRGLRPRLGHLDLENGGTEFSTALGLIREGAEIWLHVELWQRNEPWGKGLHFSLGGMPETADMIRDRIRARKAQELIDDTRIRALLSVNLTGLLGPFIFAWEA